MLTVVPVSMDSVWMSWCGMNIVLLITITCCIYELIIQSRRVLNNDGNKDSMRKNQLPFICGILFSLICFICLCLLIASGMLQLHNPSATTLAYLHVVTNLLTMSFIIQYYAFLLLLFLRIYNIFIHTTLQLSSCSIRLAKLFFVICPLLHLTVQSLQWMHQDGQSRVHSITKLISMCLWSLEYFCTLFFVCLFVYKLKQSFGIMRDSKVLSIIKKTCILSVVPLAVSLVSGILAAVHYSSNHEYVQLVSYSLLSLDIYSNFLCIVLSYRWFNRWYLILCGCVDAHCHGCWIGDANENRGNNLTLNLTLPASSTNNENEDEEAEAANSHSAIIYPYTCTSDVDSNRTEAPQTTVELQSCDTVSASSITTNSNLSSPNAVSRNLLTLPISSSLRLSNNYSTGLSPITEDHREDPPLNELVIVDYDSL